MNGGTRSPESPAFRVPPPNSVVVASARAWNVDYRGPDITTVGFTINVSYLTCPLPQVNGGAGGSLISAFWSVIKL